MDGNNNMNIKKILIISSILSSPLFLGLFTLFIAVFLVLDLFAFDASANDDGVGNGLVYESSCDYEQTKVVVMDGSNTKVLATVSLEDYIIGVACGELGACRGDADKLNEEYVKAHYIITKTFVLARGRYNSTTKKVSIRASTRDQLWCDIKDGCVMTTGDNGFTNAYPGNYPEEDMIGNISESSRRWFEEEDLKLLRKYYAETYGELFLRNDYNQAVTSLGSSDMVAYRSSTHDFWKQQAAAGKKYDEILEATANTDLSVAEYYKDKSIYKLKKYCPVISSNPSVDYTNIDYVNWMIEFAADNTHGYSMDNRRMNPDVDCSSFVYYALLNNGYTKEQIGSGPFTTYSMESILPQVGFERLPFDKDILQVGDIVWYPKGFNGKKYGHTEVYVGDGKTVGAHGNLDGKTGDSSGNEVSVVKITREYKAIFRKVA